MKTEKPALTLYLLASFLAVMATILDCDTLLLVTRPMVIPAILFYYLSIKKHQVDVFFILVLILNFIGDTIILSDFGDSMVIIMIPFFLSYLIMLKFAIEDARKIKFKKSGLGLSVLVFSAAILLLYVIVKSFMEGNEELVLPVIIYGLALAVFVSVTTYCYYLQKSLATFYLLMVALFSTVSDVFYVLFNLIFHFPEFYYFEFTIQLASYFFMVKYVVLRKTE